MADDRYKELYSLSVKVFDDERLRARHLGQKAMWFFSFLTILLGITGYFDKWIIDTVLPPRTSLDVILILNGLVLTAAGVFCWWQLFSVLRLNSVATIPLDANLFALFQNPAHELPTIYEDLAKNIRKYNEANSKQFTQLEKALSQAYKTMFAVLIALLVFGVLYAGKITITKIDSHRCQWERAQW